MQRELMKKLGLSMCIVGLFVSANVSAAGLVDTFDDGTAADWTIIAGRWNVINGEFVETSDASTYNLAIHGPARAAAIQASSFGMGRATTK